MQESLAVVVVLVMVVVVAAVTVLMNMFFNFLAVLIMIVVVMVMTIIILVWILMIIFSVIFLLSQRFLMTFMEALNCLSTRLKIFHTGMGIVVLLDDAGGLLVYYNLFAKVMVVVLVRTTMPHNTRRDGSKHESAYGCCD